jgi:hypothetical protein
MALLEERLSIERGVKSSNPIRLVTADAESRWRHKGVQPIAYDPSAGHSALWEKHAFGLFPPSK